MGNSWAKLALLLVAIQLNGLIPADGGGDTGGKAAAAAASEFPAVPAVRSYVAEPGAGWRPGTGTRVVAERGGPLEDEAELLAGELDVPVAHGEARRGDVALRLDPDRSTDGAEGYGLVAHEGRLTVSGATDTGVFYGTRTVLGSLRADGRVPGGVVQDRPDRPQRGLMIDISRKHFTRDWIEDRVREMGDLKLNQLHLHLSDDQAFRVESTSHPEIVSSGHLTKADIRSIVELAARRHITVIPEIDSPGHLGALLAAHPELQLRNARGVAARGAIDISKPAAAKILDDLLREYAKLFPGPYWHLGGDEYVALLASDPETAYPQLAALARTRYGAGGTVADATTGWLNDRAAVVRKLGKKAKAWNDGFFTSARVSPDKDREVEYWTGKEHGARDPQEYLRQSRPVVNLNDEYLYYVLGEPNAFVYPTGERIYEQWSPAVLRGNRPVPARLAGRDRILGGRFAVWCDLAGAQSPEQVAKGIRLPLAAMSQKLWDPAKPALTWKGFAARAGSTDGADSTDGAGSSADARTPAERRKAAGVASPHRS